MSGPQTETVAATAIQIGDTLVLANPHGHYRVTHRRRSATGSTILFKIETATWRGTYRARVATRVTRVVR